MNDSFRAMMIVDHDGRPRAEFRDLTVADLPDHDVVLVADESEVFGTYVPFRGWIPRPVAGTAGLMPSAL